MADRGLLWLDSFAERVNFCLTFVRGADERAIFAAFGADPNEAVRMTREEANRAAGSIVQGYGPFVRMGVSGEWLFAWEDGSWEGGRPEVLRRASAGGEAVCVLNTVGAFAGFGYAAEGEVITSLVTIVPYTREGSDPERFLPLIEEVGLVFPPVQPIPSLSPLPAVLTIAERAFGLSVERSDLERPLPCARMLPVLPALQRPSGDGVAPIGDPVIDLLMAHADQQMVRSAVAAQVRGLLSESGLDEYSELAHAVEAAVAGGGWTLADEDPAGLVLRLVKREMYEVEQDRYRGRRRLAQNERQRRSRREQAAQALQAVLTWGPEPALPAVIHCRRRVGDPAWRERLLTDLASSQVSVADLREAEQRWQAEQESGSPRRQRGHRPTDE